MNRYFISLVKFISKYFDAAVNSVVFLIFLIDSLMYRGDARFDFCDSQFCHNVTTCDSIPQVF